jgi:hypothetical protein
LPVSSFALSTDEGAQRGTKNTPGPKTNELLAEAARTETQSEESVAVALPQFEKKFNSYRQNSEIGSVKLR